MSDSVPPWGDPDASDSSPLNESLTEATSVLLLGSQMDPTTTDACFGLLEWTPPANTQVIQVTYNQSPNWMVDKWKKRIGELPAHLFVISVDGDPSRSSVQPDRITHRSARATDLTGLGIEIHRILDEVADTNEHTVVCFDSLTALLMYVDERVAFRFVRTVLGYAFRTNASIHFHVDPDAHGPGTLGVFKSVVDAVVETDETGLIRVIHR
ncbi:DUF7504 family protein [Salinigranum sp. GCM10025319]|uniref:DUF7504 family protein n=1 Tax=Salinigranum sp. GCM10025319 TaxID=3252687 RepID=UPI00361702D2